MLRTEPLNHEDVQFLTLNKPRKAMFMCICDIISTLSQWDQSCVYNKTWIKQHRSGLLPVFPSGYSWHCSENSPWAIKSNFSHGSPL